MKKEAQWVVVGKEILLDDGIHLDGLLIAHNQFTLDRSYVCQSLCAIRKLVQHITSTSQTLTECGSACSSPNPMVGRLSHTCKVRYPPIEFQQIDRYTQDLEG